jgi:hypothetical protein
MESGGGGGGEQVFGSSDSTEKKFQISDLANILHGFADLINTVDCGFI